MHVDASRIRKEKVSDSKKKKKSSVLKKKKKKTVTCEQQMLLSQCVVCHLVEHKPVVIVTSITFCELSDGVG